MSPEVTIEQGTLRGTTGKDLKGSPFFKFKGIPYAKPPLGDLRFKAPQPPEKWTGILDATQHKEKSLSKDPFTQKSQGGENCLFLNVYTKILPDGTNELSPVLFWIHGGAFIMGSGNEEEYGPGNLLTQDIVLVTINYRLGILGFISFEDPFLDIPGNAGLKDQILALQWVQKNISKFGGDPHNVTIFGESAGGVSVHLITLSPMGRGLYHKAIAQSGCALNPWVRGTRGVQSIAKILNLEGEKKVYEALMGKTLEEILEIQESLGDWWVINVQKAVGVVVEKGSKEPFLDREPIDVITSGGFNHVPLIMGYTSSEGMLFDFFKKGEPDFESVVPWYWFQKNQETKGKIEKFYFGSQNCEKKYDMLSDCYFIHGIQNCVLHQNQKTQTPVYLYRMSVETGLNVLKKILKIETPGVSHADDLGYLFSQAIAEIKPESAEEAAILKFVKLWANFAKFGNPTPDPEDSTLKVVWKPVTDNNLELLDIGEELLMRVNPELERVKFWRELEAENFAK